LAIVVAESDDEVRALGAADPTIRADAGFRVEVYPMPQAILRRPTPPPD